MDGVDFFNANLKNATFNGAILSYVDFSRANLAQADLFNTRLRDSQLQSALSIRGARLPNGSLGRDPNLLRNGHADCNMSVHTNWQVREGDVATIQSPTGQNGCHFVSQPSNIEASMWQRINLTNLWDSNLWDKSRALLFARLGNGVSIQISGESANGTVLGQARLSEIDLGCTHDLSIVFRI